MSYTRTPPTVSRAGRASQEGPLRVPLIAPTPYVEYNYMVCDNNVL